MPAAVPPASTRAPASRVFTSSTTHDRDVIWVAQGGRANVPAMLVAFDPAAKKFVAEVPVGTPGPNTIRHMTFDRATRQIWFGTDQGAVGRVTIPPLALVP